MTLDNLGRVSSISPPGVQPVQFHYDTKGRNDTITQGNRVTTFGFDPTGAFVNSITDPLGHVTALTTDPVGRPTLATQPDATTIGVSYDSSGNVTSVTPPGRPAHGFRYDLADEETLYTPPDAGVAMSTVTSYNQDEQVRLVTRPDTDTIVPCTSLMAAGCRP
jgi:YD repeat-containing protein